VCNQIKIDHRRNHTKSPLHKGEVETGALEEEHDLEDGVTKAGEQVVGLIESQKEYCLYI
jgi:hypothetical protein